MGGGVTMDEKRYVEVEGVKVDTNIANRLLSKIIIWEKNNIKTKQLQSSSMVKKISSAIEEEVKCY